MVQTGDRRLVWFDQETEDWCGLIRRQKTGVVQTGDRGLVWFDQESGTDRIGIG